MFFVCGGGKFLFKNLYNLVMFKPRKKENKTLSEIKSYLTTNALIKIGLLTALTIAYG